jgi:acetyl esterase/lipase
MTTSCVSCLPLRWLFWVVLGVAAASPLFAEEPRAVPPKAAPAKASAKDASELRATFKDQTYGPHARNVLDLYRPDSEGPTAVLVYFHGGGFVAGDKREAAGLPIVRECWKAGIAVVSANYRFVGKRPGESEATTYPAPMLDGARVVQFARSKAEEWKLDPKRVAVSGISAGACMAMWIALHDELANPKSDDPVLRQSTRVSGAVAYAGPTTLDPREILKHVGGNPSIHPSLLPFFGVAKIEELNELPKKRVVADASAITHVSKDDPPLYLFYLGKYSNAPLPPETNINLSIHHAMFGKLLQDKCAELGVACQFVCGETERKQTELEFLKAIFSKK